MSQQVLNQPVAATALPTGTWSIDPDHSRVGFSIRHLGIETIHGEFTSFEGAIEVGGDQQPGVQAHGSVAVASIFTHQPRRDDHLRSADFFDAESYPTVTFSSTGIEAAEDGTLLISGDLTMHGVTNEVLLGAIFEGTAVDQFGNERLSLEVTGELSRGDYGVSFNLPLDGGAKLLGERVRLELGISAIRQS